MNRTSLLKHEPSHKQQVVKTKLDSSLPPVVCVRADVLITMFGSSLPPVVCMRAHVLITMFGSEPNIVIKT
jgi:hypothetical protein